jgi:glycosyltransferase involved in cell wall biosynthesis
MKPNQLEESIDFLPQGTRLLSVCRLDANEGEKGIETVLRSIPLILSSVPDLNYLVIGDGTDLNRHKQLASEIGIADRVHFLGSVDESLLRRCYRACDIFVLPSAQEGFGIVYLEAMHHRKPIVAARSGAAPEVVKDGETGLLVEYGNVEQLANVVARLCLSSNLRAILGTAGYRHLQQNFTFEHFRRRLTDIILSEVPAAIVGVDRHKPGLADSIN